MADLNRRKDDSGWKIDKHIPIAVLLALLIQTATVVWWASNMDARVKVLETWQSKNDTMNERLARIEEGVRFLMQQKGGQ